MVDRPPGAVAEMHYALNSHIFGTNTSMKFEEIADGTSNTFMGGEISDGFRLWGNPYHTRDPALGFNAGPLTFGSPYFRTGKSGGVNMLFVDGSVRWINDSVSPSVLAALATPAGGETVSLP
jgi:prepilin-type processing-associated H-X9-DG protein